MTDLIKHSTNNGNTRAKAIMASTLGDALRLACTEVGIVERDVPVDGRWHKANIDGDSRGRGDGRIRLFPDGQGGVVCNWKSNERRLFFVGDGLRLTEAERCDREKRRVEAIIRSNKERDREHAAAEQRAARFWDAASPANGAHAYLTKKGVPPHGLRVRRGVLIVPVYKDDRLRTCQFIAPSGSKKFLTGGEAAGGYFCIGELNGASTIGIAEGFATAASAHKATSFPVIAALSSGNLAAVASKIRERYPAAKVVVLADLVKTTGKPDPHAIEAARACGGTLAIPRFPKPRDPSHKDMNDLTAVCGVEAVRAAIVGAEAPPEDKGNGKAVAGHGLEGVAEFGEDRLAAKFTELHGKDWRYVDKWGKWVMWTLSRWLIDDTRAALHLVRLICRDAASSADDARAANKLATRNTVSGVEALARGDRRHAMTSDSWDKDPYLLNALKGTVELYTGALREHRREDYITKAAGATPQGECPRWMAFLDEITAEDEDYQEYLQRMAGYMLTGDTSEHALFFGHGPGGNGKSVFAGVLAAIMGDYAATAPMDMFMEKKGESHPTELAGLRGSRLVLCTETEKGRRWAEAKIKALTGGDRISARFMRQDFFEFTPQFKLLVIGNHRPFIRSVNEAIRRRLHLLPFTVSIPTARRDKKIQEKLLLERDGILAWAFEGCLKWQLEGLNPPKCVVDATEEYFQEEDAVAQFLDEECEQISGARVAIKDLFARWKDRAESRGEYVGSSKGLAGELVTHGFKRCRLGGGDKGLAGLCLKTPTL